MLDCPGDPPEQPRSQSVREAIGQDYQIALQNEQALQRSIDLLRAEALDEQDRALQYDILKREADTSRLLYENLLKRQHELSGVSASPSALLSVLDWATVPEAPVRPRILLNMLLAMATGLGLALFTIFLREAVQSKIRSPEDLERLGLPLLAAAPKSVSRGEAAHALAEPRSPLTEAFQHVPTLLALSSFGACPKRIAVVSSVGGEGRSVACLGIARAFAKKGERVLLIDADLRNAALPHIIDVDAGAGFGELVAGTTATAQPASIRLNLDFLQAGDLQTNPAELLAAADLDGIFAGLEEDYDRLIIDTPPLSGSADALRLASCSDIFILVVGANATDETTALSSIRRLSAVKQPSGAILTAYDPRMAGDPAPA